jgi:maltose alpha-D-glucosyltransferase/alpha-amylase
MTDIQPAALATLQERAEEWRREVTGAFMSRYREVMAGAPSMPEDPAVADALVEFFALEKALYEIDYELANRPAWVAIPLAGVLGLVPAESLSHADA